MIGGSVDAGVVGAAALIVGSSGTVGALLVPAAARRGAVLVAAVALLVATASSAAPEGVRTGAVYGAIGLLAAAAALGPGAPSAPRGGAIVGLTAVSFTVALATTVVGDPEAVGLTVRVGALAVGAAWCVLRASPTDLRVLGAGVVVIASLEVALGLVEFATGDPVPWGRRHRDVNDYVLVNTLLPGGLERVQGTLGHPITYGVVLCTAFVVTVAAGRRVPLPARVLVASALMVGMLLSGSRSVVLAAILAVAVLVVAASEGRGAVRAAAALLGVGVAVVVFVDELGVASDRFVSSGSYENRAGTIGSVPRLLGRPLLEVVFGSGVGTVERLYDEGLFPQDGFWVLDNQLVTTLATQGVLGVALSVAVLVIALATRDPLARALCAVFVGMLVTFDYVFWPSMTVLASGAAALAGRPPDPGPDLDLDPPGSAP
ncbi:hypothetical protein ASF17_13590 [Frigoribacterium sp. Leaf263]|uniref:hypothetical protein n=1 Tax=Frigoribacterium sp. Leaf263 TaxID=1736313 RepID=UPI0006F3F135|nr:hypothetical protein [Frigoribacterium sp. Leaf263]KQO81142.1 hypothetical protein ASF17_13590 [Frigoribacterium sp. Leaf263]